MSKFGLGITGGGSSAYVNDQYVTCLVHFDGTSGSNHFYDASQSRLGHMSVAAGCISAGPDIYSRPAFGDSCTYFNGATGYAYWPGAAAAVPFTFGTQDFTIDWWEMRHSAEDSRPSMSWDGNAYTYQRFLIGWSSSGNLFAYCSTNTTDWNGFSGLPMGPIAVNTWIHYALVRKGNTIYSFRNGILQGTAPMTVSVPASNTSPILGLWQTDGAASAYYNYARIDEWRVSKGIARWTANFTPPIAAYGPDPDLKTVLLLHGDGAEDGALMPDSSQHNDNYAIGAYCRTKSPGKFGPTSINFTGADGNSVVHYTNREDFDFGAGDFTMDWWEYRLDAINGRPIASRSLDVGYPPFLIFTNSGNVTFFASSDGANWNIANSLSMGPIVINQWVHRAITRRGNTFRFFQDGVIQNTLTSSATIANGGNNLAIGYYNNGAYLYYGKIDEFRIVKGEARYIGNFTPPTAPYDIANTPAPIPDNPATYFVVTAPATANTASAFSFVVQAKDAGGGNTRNYSGTVHFTATGGGINLPADVALLNGVGTFSAQITAPATRAIIATDTVTGSITGTSGNIVATSYVAGSVIFYSTQWWTVPAGFNPGNNYCEVHGAGGGGGACLATYGGAGGGGGQYAQSVNMPFNAGDSILIYVGAGGSGAPSPPDQYTPTGVNGGGGGHSGIINAAQTLWYALAYGGGGGSSAGYSGGDPGGSGGVASPVANYAAYNGGWGGASPYSDGAAGGGCAGPSGPGSGQYPGGGFAGYGGQAASYAEDGYGGGAYGGGGGGCGFGRFGAGYNVGGPGAQGIVRITWGA